MEVHIRNVPEQATENGLKTFLKPHLERLAIQAYHCQKQRGKKYASLTFLYIRDGERFLAHHGQVKKPLSHNNRSHTATNIPSNLVAQRPQVIGASQYAINLKFLNKPIYCEKSTREGDPFLLRVLEREEKAKREIRSTAARTATNDPHAKQDKLLPLLFKCTFASCGVWTYTNSELVYAPQRRWVVNGKVKFRERFNFGLRIREEN